MMIAKSSVFVVALALVGGSASAAISQDREQVTVQGAQGALTADLDPGKDRPDGLTGDQIARDIDPADRYAAFQELNKTLSGPLEEFYDWQGVHERGFFIPTREFDEAGLRCRDFTEQTEHQGSEGLDPMHDPFNEPPSVVFGTACHERDGWHFR
jgi:hypothetical protein